MEEEMLALVKVIRAAAATTPNPTHRIAALVLVAATEGLHQQITRDEFVSVARHGEMQSALAAAIAARRN